MLDTGKLDRITTFPALVDYLRDELDWPIEEFSLDDLTFEWDPKEFGLSTDGALGQIEIKQLRPLEAESWGIFFLSLPHKKLPVTVFRRILGSLAPKKRASSNPADRAVWNKHDLLFIAAHGAGDERGLAFAHFHENKEHGDLPTLNVLGWDGADTIRRLSDTHRTLKDKLHWREGGENADAWRERWNSGFKERPGETIATSKALAKELARLAREIRRRANELLVEENDKGPLRTLHKAFKEALIHDLKFDDFADMYAQTIAYGLLAARISRESGALVADNAADLAPPTNPFLKELLQTFFSAGGRRGGMDFDELGVNDVVEMLRGADMHAVLLDFDTKNPSEDPVIHFYELFLKEYDAKKRMQRGVFYTPRPVVSFIVRSVDEVLQTEFGLEDGLASTATWGEVIAAKPEITLPHDAKESDPFVCILDPATGTGTFLVEVVDLVYGRISDRWRNAGKSATEIEALWNEYVPRHLLPRLYGFELMMAPYAIAHMKLGLKLAETGYHFHSDERARIYLTNALEPAQDFDLQLSFMSEALAHEAQAANRAKEVRFTAVIGNPPYAGHSSNPSRRPSGKLTHIGELIRPYFFVDGEPLGESNPKWINNDYIKFLRLAQTTLIDAGAGVLGFITSNSWLESPTFRGVRASFLGDFPRLWIADLHGHLKRREKAADGSSDEGVFEIEEGTCITVALFLSGRLPDVRQMNLLGTATAKFDWLLRSDLKNVCDPIVPTRPLLQLKPRNQQGGEYESFAPLMEVLSSASLGILTKRDALCVALDEETLLEKITSFADDQIPDSEIAHRFGLPSADKDTWNLKNARRIIKPVSTKKLIDFQYRPFDRQTLYYDKTIVARPNTRVLAGLHEPGNLALVVGRQGGATGSEVWDVCFVTDIVPDQNIYRRGGGTVFPMWLMANHSLGSRLLNVDVKFATKVAALSGLRFDPDLDVANSGTLGPRDVLNWIYAVLNSLNYRKRYADDLRSEFPRIPLPGSKELFRELVPLGTKLVALHLLDVDGATELKDPQGVRFAGHGEARIENKPEWTAAGGNRVTISDHRWFEGVSERAWSFHIGGYQPAQKWLKDRAKKGGAKASPGHVLTTADQLQYRRMVVAMDKTVELMAEIDRVIDKHGGWPGAFTGMTDADVAA